MNNTVDVTLSGMSANYYFRRSVSTAGDLNGEGYSDVIVGADEYSSNTRRAYVFFGGASPDNVSDVTMTGEATNNYFGFSVSKTGDVNGDGFSDIIIGDYHYPSGNSSGELTYISEEY